MKRSIVNEEVGWVRPGIMDATRYHSSKNIHQDFLFSFFSLIYFLCWYLIFIAHFLLKIFFDDLGFLPSLDCLLWYLIFCFLFLSLSLSLSLFFWLFFDTRLNPFHQKGKIALYRTGSVDCLLASPTRPHPPSSPIMVFLRPFSSPTLKHPATHLLFAPVSPRNKSGMICSFTCAF